MPLLAHNITTNSSQFANPAQLRATVLDWEQDLPEDVRAIGGFDIILYDTIMFAVFIL
jgi:hypothetical protein